MSAGTRWIAMVFGLLGLSVAIQGVAIFLAVGDPSFAIEPDYEQKAASYDAIRLQRRRNAALGWSVAVRAAPDTLGALHVELTLCDGVGQPIDAAHIELEALHVAAAARVLRAHLAARGNGVYHCSLPMHRSGIWEFHIDASRGEDHFTAVVRESIACLDLMGSR